MIQLFNKNRRLALYLLVFNVLFLPTLALAQNQADGFVGLVQLPGLDKPNEIDLQSYIDALIRISIIIAALIAVIKLIMAGARYVLSSVVTEKANAKGDIYSALIGLLIIIGAITILREINPNLVGLPVLENAPSFENRPGPNIKVVSDKTVDEICKEGAGGCKTESCSIFDSPNGIYNTMYSLLGSESVSDVGYLVGFIPKLTGMDYLANTVSCKTLCTWRAGKVINKSVGGSGECVYPNNPEAVAAARKAAGEALTKAGIESQVVTFGDVPQTSTVETDFRNNLSRQIDSISDIKGYYEISAQELNSLYEGDGDIGKYDEVFEKVLDGTCKGAGGTEVIPFSSISTGGFRYYCI